ncbi:helix-hairpin-helix domain-containing protein [Aliikangiella marina]|uniref:Helix-hairpin-helix domain-containing protein n=1 Tax=Aliikangiella marina TaxID=1712262 RepID=A0A545TI59_9GAMM|nr:helix-hairpin-helix domain-containing protein [Aliikangiella marina]TQV76888.1 helix-hairpin-helix domain-containing protein [Aliikangiella marina]
MKNMILVVTLILGLVGFSQSTIAKSASSKPIQKSSMIAKHLKVNLNTAGAKELAEALTGVGIKKANAIVEYRKANGKFKSIEELANVKGIGVNTIAKNHGRMAI